MTPHKLESQQNGSDEVLITCELCNYRRAIPLGLNGEMLLPGMILDYGDETASHVYASPGFSMGAEVKT